MNRGQPFFILHTHRIIRTIRIRADVVVLLGQRVLAEPGRGPGIVEPGAEVQVGSAGGCRRGARKCARNEACVNDLACNFLATETVAEGRLRGIRAGGPASTDASERIVVESLENGPGPVLDDPHAAEVVGNVVEDLVIACPGQQATALPARALQGECARGGAQDVEVSDAHPAFRSDGARIDGEQGPVSRIDPPCGVGPVGDAHRQSDDVPCERRPAEGVCGHVAMGVVRVAASLRACVGEGQGVGGGRPGGGAVSLEGEQASVPVVGDVLLGQRCKRRCGGSAVSGTPDKASGAVVLIGARVRLGRRPVCRRPRLPGKKWVCFL